MVMPCSRSASRPSSSSAKSMFSPCVPCLTLSFFRRRKLVLEDQLGVVEQPADQRGLAVVDRAAGEEAQHALFGGREFAHRLALVLRACARGSPSWPSEIALALLLLHRPALVMVDEAAGALRGARGQHLADDVVERGGVAFDGGG